MFDPVAQFLDERQLEEVAQFGIRSNRFVGEVVGAFHRHAERGHASPLHYAVQVSTISDVTSAMPLADKLRAEINTRVDAIFDPAGGAYRVLAGDFPDAASANPLDNREFRGFF